MNDFGTAKRMSPDYESEWIAARDREYRLRQAAADRQAIDAAAQKLKDSERTPSNERQGETPCTSGDSTRETLTTGRPGT
jgi:hypothetical protein